MNKWLHPTMNALLIRALFFFIVASIFCFGFHHYDEHFQLLEFGAMKLGFVDPQTLTWEYKAQCRSGILPAIVFVLGKAMTMLGVYQPFMLSFVLRLMMAIWTWFTIRKFIIKTENQYSTNQVFYLTVLFAGIWFMPYLAVRYSSEQVALLLMFQSVMMILWDKLSTKKIIIIGFLLGLCLSVRLQMGFAMIGIAAYLIFIARWQWLKILPLIFGGLISIGLSILVDYWFYQEWVFVPYEYFKVNIIQDVASNYGVTPFYQYFIEAINYMLPPLSIILIILFICGLPKMKNSIALYILVPFILGHSMIGHKEMRFLFPIFPYFLWIAAVGLNILSLKWKSRSWWQPVWMTLVIINSIILVVRTFMPATLQLITLQNAYHESKQGKTLVVFAIGKVYPIPRFYAHPNADWISADQYNANLDFNYDKILVFSDTKNPQLGELKLKHQEPICTDLPSWIYKFNINGWIDRTKIHGLYQIK